MDEHDAQIVPELPRQRHPLLHASVRGAIDGLAGGDDARDRWVVDDPDQHLMDHLDLDAQLTRATRIDKQPQRNDADRNLHGDHRGLPPDGRLGALQQPRNDRALAAVGQAHAYESTFLATVDVLIHVDSSHSYSRRGGRLQAVIAGPPRVVLIRFWHNFPSLLRSRHASSLRSDPPGHLMSVSI